MPTECTECDLSVGYVCKFCHLENNFDELRRERDKYMNAAHVAWEQLDLAKRDLIKLQSACQEFRNEAEQTMLLTAFEGGEPGYLEDVLKVFDRMFAGLVPCHKCDGTKFDPDTLNGECEACQSKGT